jgi:hypothetical protein
MLAYIFWHWPRPEVAVDDYVARQRAFHQKLAAHRPSGLISSSVWRVTDVPWSGGWNDITYEDWYLLTSSADLDTLNAAAVSDALRETHDAAASLAAGGVAALYTPAAPQVGPEPALDGTSAQWFSKPEGMRYSALYQQLGPRLDHLWTRMMVLGPSPEFLLLGDDIHALPPEWRAQTTHRERVWPPEAAPSAVAMESIEED